MRKYDFSGSYPARCEAFYRGRIMNHQFEDIIGIPCPPEYKFYISTEGHFLVGLRDDTGLLTTIEMLRDMFVLNIRCGRVEWNDDIMLKWIMERSVE